MRHWYLKLGNEHLYGLFRAGMIYNFLISILLIKLSQYIYIVGVSDDPRLGFR